ncbi:hypothetical protein B2J88_52400, partial [Rhodococcus sp. SRB_17]|nr:hypothetical protein [Rhodococcus sp. SRB_17]
MHAPTQATTEIAGDLVLAADECRRPRRVPYESDIRSSESHDRAAHPIALTQIPGPRKGAEVLIGLVLVALALICSCAGAQ